MHRVLCPAGLVLADKCGHFTVRVQGGDATGLKLEVLNAQLLSSLSVGSQLLQSLQPAGQPLSADQVCGTAPNVLTSACSRTKQRA